MPTADSLREEAGDGNDDAGEHCGENERKDSRDKGERRGLEGRRGCHDGTGVVIWRGQAKVHPFARAV